MMQEGVIRYAAVEGYPLALQGLEKSMSSQSRQNRAEHYNARLYRSIIHIIQHTCSESHILGEMLDDLFPSLRYFVLYFSIFLIPKHWFMWCITGHNMKTKKWFTW